MIYVCFSYVPPQNSVYFNLHPVGFFESIVSGIRKYSESGKIIWMGDLNPGCGNKSDIIQDRDIFDRYIPVVETDYSARGYRLPVRNSMDTNTNASGNRLN